MPANMPEFAVLLHAALGGLGVIVAIGFATWLASLIYKDVSIVDRVWPVFMLAGGLSYAYVFHGESNNAVRAGITLVLVAVWALRLSGYITWRSWRGEEDRRYQEIRARNEPGFAFKSLYLVFALQAVLAWIVTAPLLVAMASARPPSWLDAVGIMLAAFGIVFEGIADTQMGVFKAKPQNKGAVMDRGLWRYTRHPNYFGECCTWWGFFIIALAAGGAVDGAWSGAWSVVSPLLLTVLLLKVSGVSLLEKDIGERRPGYREYIARTNAFLPGPRKSGSAG